MKKSMHFQKVIKPGEDRERAGGDIGLVLREWDFANPASVSVHELNPAEMEKTIMGLYHYFSASSGKADLEELKENVATMAAIHQMFYNSMYGNMGYSKEDVIAFTKAVVTGSSVDAVASMADSGFSNSKTDQRWINALDAKDYSPKDFFKNDLGYDEIEGILVPPSRKTSFYVHEDFKSEDGKSVSVYKADGDYIVLAGPFPAIWRYVTSRNWDESNIIAEYSKVNKDGVDTVKKAVRLIRKGRLSENKLERILIDPSCLEPFQKSGINYEFGGTEEYPGGNQLLRMRPIGGKYTH